MNTSKIQKTYLDYGFGFPVQIVNAPLKKVDGEWVLNLNFEKYERAVLVALAMKTTRLSGNEITFIRHHFEMSLKSFGKRFGDVAHSAVIKWEKAGDDCTNMNWATEKDIRLATIDKIRPKILRQVYSKLEETAPRKPKKIKIDSSEVKAA
jgi:DNA-binding transcriptional regulator YiaG